MEIIKAEDEGKLCLKLIGRIDSVTVSQLEEHLSALQGIKTLELDFAGVEYISSAGLRALLLASKQMKRQGTMEITRVNKTVMEVFFITGFTDILNIREWNGGDNERKEAIEGSDCSADNCDTGAAD